MKKLLLFALTLLVGQICFASQSKTKTCDNNVSQVFKNVFIELPGFREIQVLHHPKRANHRAIHTAKREREQHQRHYHHHIQSQHGRQKLHFRHPAKPLVCDASEIKQQQCNQHIKHSRQPYSNFP